MAGHAEHLARANHDHKRRPYAMRFVSLGVSCVVMFALMYSMADRFEHVYLVQESDAPSRGGT